MLTRTRTHTHTPLDSWPSRCSPPIPQWACTRQCSFRMLTSWRIVCVSYALRVLVRHTKVFTALSQVQLVLRMARSLRHVRDVNLQRSMLAVLCRFVMFWGTEPWLRPYIVRCVALRRGAFFFFLF